MSIQIFSRETTPRTYWDLRITKKLYASAIADRRFDDAARYQRHISEIETDIKNFLQRLPR